MISFSFIALALGIIVGSFLNVVILRHNTGKGINGRSECLSCRKQLTWKELLPLISFFIQKRRCAGCDSLLRWQYPLVEITTGLLFFFTYIKFEALLYENAVLFFIVLLCNVIIWSTLVVIFVYDLYHTIIPNVFVYMFIVFAACIAGIDFHAQQSVLSSIDALAILDLVAGPLLLLPFFVLWDISDGKWIGLGDGKLAIGIGLLLGFVNGISTIILSFWIGAAYSVAYLLYMVVVKKKERSGITRQIPFAPFMIIATVAIYFFPVDILNIGIFFLQ